MAEAGRSNGLGNMEHQPWRGVDFSGVILVLGVGTGQLIELLNRQVAASGGHLVVVSYNLQSLKPLMSLRGVGYLTLIHARPRQVPLASETVDLLVVNGILREVPEARYTAMFEELWRVLVPGGRLRISDIIEPSEAKYNDAWAERNRIVRKLGEALQRPTALAVNLQRAALAARAVGLENMGLSFLPGYVLTDAWLEETISAVRNMAARVADRDVRNEILTHDIQRLLAAYAQGEQRAAERFVLRGAKPGDLALDMEASFIEDDLLGTED